MKPAALLNGCLILVVLLLALISHSSEAAVCTPIDWNARPGASGLRCTTSNVANYRPPSGVTSCNQVVPTALVNSLDTVYPEGSSPDPSMIGRTIFVSITQSNTYLNVTYIDTGAWWVNRFGYFTWDNVTNTKGPLMPIFPRLNNNDGGTLPVGCLRAGDTFRVGPFSAGQNVGFYLDPKSGADSELLPLHSFTSPPNLVNPDPKNVCPNSPGGCAQTAWINFVEYDVAIIGFEDQVLGDRDYNDVLFFFTVDGGGDLPDIPDFEDGVIKTCNVLESVTTSSYTEINCTQWALLESSTTSSCLIYFSVPPGWTWAPNDATSRDAIVRMADKWAYTKASCFLLSNNATSGVGYFTNGTQCSVQAAPVRWISSSGRVCYNTICGARYVLKGATLGTSCSGGGGICSNATSGAILATFPTGVSAPVLPTQYSVFLKAPGGSQALTTSVKVAADKQELLDLVIFIDTQGLSGDDRTALISAGSNIFSSLSSAGFLPNDLSVAQFGTQVGVSFSSGASPYFTVPTWVYNQTQLTTQLGSFAATGSGSATTSRVPEGLTNLMLSPNVAWRRDALKVVWVISRNSWTQSTSINNALKSASVASAVIPIFHFNIRSSSANLPSGWSTVNNALPWAAITRGNNRNSDVHFSNVFASSSNVGASYFAGTTATRLYLVPSGGSTNFLTGVDETQYVTQSRGGTKDLTYGVAWPSTSTSTTVSGYSTQVTVMGRDRTDISISFNHPPTVNNALATVGPVTTETTVSFSAADPDANTLTWKLLTLPTKGSLKRATGEALTVGSTVLGAADIIYVPNIGASGTDTFRYEVSDGCLAAGGTATITIILANSPPVATDFTIEVNEESTFADLAGTNGLIDFTGKYSDIDVGQALTLQLTSYPSVGKLSTYTVNLAGADIAPLSVIANQIRYQPLTALPQTLSFKYIVRDDKGAVSNEATVTIIIKPIPHAPILIVPVTSFSAVLSDTGNIPITASIFDQDENDRVNLKVVSASPSISQQMVAENTFSIASDISTFRFYSANLTNGPTFPCTGLAWVDPSASSDPAWVVLQAVDLTGRVSNTVNVSIALSSVRPPRWVERPQVGSVPPFETPQDTPYPNMKFSATDQDATEWQDLIYRIVQMPAHGTLQIKNVVTGALLNVPNGATYSNTSSTYVALNSTASTSFFTLQYTPNTGYFGSDTFVWQVRDPTGLDAAEVAVVNINVLRANTRPISTNCTITTNEDQRVAFSLSAISTNPPGTNPVFLQLESLTADGRLVDVGTSAGWTANSSSTTSGSVPFTFLPNPGVFSPVANQPVGALTFTVFEPATSLVSAITYNCQIIVNRVNKPPVSEDQSHRIKKREVLSVVLPVYDRDPDDPPSTLTTTLVSLGFGNVGQLYRDAALTDPITSAPVVLVNHSLWYVSTDAFSVPANSPLATYKFQVQDKQSAASPVYDGRIFVDPAGDPPVFNGELVFTTFQETPLPMFLASSVTTETGNANVTIKIIEVPDTVKGTFAACNDLGVCPIVTSAPYTLDSTLGRVVYTPRDNDWGQNYTSYQFQLIDDTSGATSNWTAYINVIHVNKRPVITPANFPLLGEGSVTINESQNAVLNWYATDVDSLPSTLQTSMQITFYTSFGFSLYECTFEPGVDFNTSRCVFNPATPWAVRADFRANARKFINSYQVVSTSCPNLDVLKELTLSGGSTAACRSHFKMNFVPTVDASYSPYISIRMWANDNEDATSVPINVLLLVKAVNTPPTIWSPPLVLGSGIFNPFIRDTTQTSPTFNQPVIVGDEDSGNAEEQLTITVTSGSGNLTWPSDANCAVDNSLPQTWVCMGRIAVMNSWLPDIRFNVTSSGETPTANLLFTINDLGNSGDYIPSPQLTASSSTTVRIVPAAAPKSGSSTLAIAVGVAAGAGLLLLGALGFFLRKAVAPPADDYFSAATTPLSAAPQSPLYAPQNTESFSPLYKGN